MMDRFYRILSIALSAIMCLLGLGMLFGLASPWTSLTPGFLMRFLTVAFLPFAWAIVVWILNRTRRKQIVIAAMTAVVFVGFIGAVDLANGRPLYSGLSYLK